MDPMKWFLLGTLLGLPTGVVVAMLYWEWVDRKHIQRPIEPPNNQGSGYGPTTGS
jgi:hypothetical protein